MARNIFFAVMIGILAFVQPATFLAWQLPGIDACHSGLANDIANANRPIGTGYDMGPYEANFRYVFVPVIKK